MENEGYSNLVARFYDAFLEDSVEDISFFERHIKNKKANVLELAAGTGRILIPLAKRNMSIDGLDSSIDMLNILKEKINSEGLNTNLFNMSMANFNIDRKYDYIFVACGSFMLMETEEAKKCLSCVKDHLSDKGEFIIDLFIPWDDIRKQPNESMRIVRDVTVGRERCIVYEAFTIDIQNQRKLGKYKYEHYIEGKLVNTEINELNVRWYYENEIVEMLRKEGFSDINVLVDEKEYTRNDSFIISASNK